MPGASLAESLEYCKDKQLRGAFIIKTLLVQQNTEQQQQLLKHSEQYSRAHKKINNNNKKADKKMQRTRKMQADDIGTHKSALK